MPYKDPTLRKQKSAERSDRWNKRNPEKSADKARDWRRRNPDYMLHKMAERRARVDGTLFEITREDIPEIPAVCPIALIPIHFKEERTKGPCDNSPTLDRVDPTLGYVVGNIRVISYKANRWKSNMSVQDVERIVRYMRNEI